MAKRDADLVMLAPMTLALTPEPLRDATQVSAAKTRVLTDLQAAFGESRVRVIYGYETRFKRIQVLKQPKSHANNAVAIACELGEVVKPAEAVHQIRCLPRGQYQRFNGAHSEHKCWAPRNVRGFKLYELVKAKGQIGYIGGRREKGAFVIKDVASGKRLLEITPSKLRRVTRPSQSWMITSVTLERIDQEDFLLRESQKAWRANYDGTMGWTGTRLRVPSPPPESRPSR